MPDSASFTNVGKFRLASAMEYRFGIREMYINMYIHTTPRSALDDVAPLKRVGWAT